MTARRHYRVHLAAAGTFTGPAKEMAGIMAIRSVSQKAPRLAPS